MEKIIVLQDVFLGKQDGHLGRKMMQGLLKVLSEREWQPKAIFLLGESVRLCTDEFPVIPHLQALTAQGVEILTCRAASEELNLGEKLKVGKIASTGKLIELMADYEVISL
ncbi:MAG: hypothetical protein M0Z55_09805 [Peptococcaceae bacterium]|nr:hypothetical protein [Peptococcaceae bacterium]